MGEEQQDGIIFIMENKGLDRDARWTDGLGGGWSSQSTSKTSKPSKLCSASTEAVELRLDGGGSQPEALARGRSEAEATAGLGLGYCCDGCGTANWPAKRD